MENRETVNLTSGNRLMRSLFSGSMALVLAALTTEAWAQSSAENALESHAPGSMPLSAVIADMRRSPFYTSESLVPLGSNMAGHLWAPLAVGSPRSSIWWAANDSTFPAGRVFLAALGSSALTVYPAAAHLHGSALQLSPPISGRICTSRIRRRRGRHACRSTVRSGSRGISIRCGRRLGSLYRCCAPGWQRQWF